MSALATSAPRRPHQEDAVRFACQTLPRLDAACVPKVRHWVLERARAWGVGAQGLDNLAVVVVELVTNALEHTSDPVPSAQVVLVHTCEGAVWVEVCDSGRDDGAAPALVPPPAGGQDAVALLAEHGRGMQLVNALCEVWGVAEAVRGYPEVGHVVWARPREAQAPVPDLAA